MNTNAIALQQLADFVAAQVHGQLAANPAPTSTTSAIEHIIVALMIIGRAVTSIRTSGSPIQMIKSIFGGSTHTATTLSVAANPGQNVPVVNPATPPAAPVAAAAPK